MNFWLLFEILFHLMLVTSIVVLWIKLNRPQKDDPRMSRGLQILQSKISVLEDLSDRTEVQVKQLTAILENKCKEIQEKISEADKQIQKIDISKQKSLEVAQIFQDKIPHDEIRERQSMVKYVKAARLAHQGMGVAEIAHQVDLSLGEIEFIAKVNRNELMFCEESLPDWIHDTHEPASNHIEKTQSKSEVQLEYNLNRVQIDESHQEELKKLGNAFLSGASMNQKVESEAHSPSHLGIRPVEFRRIKTNDSIT